MVARNELRPIGRINQPRYGLRSPLSLTNDGWTRDDFEIICGSSGNFELFLPLAADFPGRVVSGRRIYDGIDRSGSLLFKRQGGDTVESAVSLLVKDLSTYYFQSDGVSNWYLVGGPYPSPVVALTDAATIAIDAAFGVGGNPLIATVTLAGNRTLGAPSNPNDGRRLILRIKQDGTGSRTLAYNAVYRFPSDIPTPILSTAANATDILAFMYNAPAVKWDCVSAIIGYT
jgi:hypothetical protein